MQIRIDASTTDDVIRAIRRAEGDAIRPASISLGSAIELALWEAHCDTANGELREWSKDHIFLNEASAYVRDGTIRAVEPFELRDSEFFGMEDARDLNTLLGGQFLSRFAAAVRRAGYQQFAQGISGVLHDLSDNIAQHGRIGDPDRKVRGLVAYNVVEDGLSFVIADDGVGVLASLKTNRDWSHLKSDREALLAIARDHASRREGQGEGQGYKDLFTVLARFDGLVRLRSYTGTFEIRGALDRLTPTGSIGPQIPGLQVTVECRFRK